MQCYKDAFILQKNILKINSEFQSQSLRSIMNTYATHYRFLPTIR